jgi:hypothetical protein
MTYAPARSRCGVGRLIRDTMHYRFRIRSVFGRPDARFELMVGMQGEQDNELIPMHRTAFAKRFQLQQSHRSEAEVQQELDSVMEWLASRRG